MESKEFNDAVGKIMGVKVGVKWCEVLKLVTTGEVTVRLIVKASEIQKKKLMALIQNSNS